MAVIKNVFAVIGLLTLIGIGVGYAKLAPVLSNFDPEFTTIYGDFAQRLLETQDPGSTMVYSVEVEDGLGVEEVKESLVNLATERNFLPVGEAPFYKQVQAVFDEPYRHVTFMSFCDVGVGRMMADYNDVYTAFMPCRIAVVEDQNQPGKLWLHTMALDMMIHGGRELPEPLKSEATRIWGVMQEIMQGAAAGEF